MTEMGVPWQIGNPAYILSCFDTGLELKHSISLYVREWNTLEEFLLYGSSSGASGDPDVGDVDAG